jgi:hypothetical protein
LYLPLFQLSSLFVLQRISSEEIFDAYSFVPIDQSKSLLYSHFLDWT